MQNERTAILGLAFGGNKLRKLEFIVPDAIASGADTLVTIGGVQSNHTRMVAATAAKIGMKCRLVQESWVPHEDAVYDRVGNIMLSRIMGARWSWSTKASILVSGTAGERRSRMSKQRGQALRHSGGRFRAQIWRPRLCGFAEEVRAQERQLGFTFDYVIVCTVTGSTHAGMVVGFAADGRARRVIGIDASATPAQTKAQVLQIARDTAQLVELGSDIAEEDMVLLEDYAYPAYGIPSEDTKDGNPPLRAA